MSTLIDDAKKAVIFGEDVTQGLDLGSIAIVCELVEIKDGAAKLRIVMRSTTGSFGDRVQEDVHLYPGYSLTLANLHRLFTMSVT